ncbi:MAG: hypothetical protein HOY79_04770 [Streptomyces sp.]|nr:hypothetical protein [Streptomyces sp.]NUS15397.1 hypothetical protein [Streptomyces sp.]NUS24022.1 hypothetical protein [Streptomyces sp.]
MTEYNDPNAAFDGIINSNHWSGNPQASVPTAPPPGYTDPHPYGPPAPGRPVKTGLTPRGKAGIAVVTAIVAGGGLLGYQHYAAAQAANQVKAQQLAIQQQELDLRKQKALEKANQAAAKTASAQETARQKQIDACVQANKGLVGKQLGQTLSGVISDCQAQYPASANTGDMQEAANTQSTGGGGADKGLLIGVGVLVAGVVLVVRKASKPAPQPVHVYQGYPNSGYPNYPTS